MGESTVIAHAMLTILSISLAAIFAGVLISTSYKISNSVSNIVYTQSNIISTNVKIIYISRIQINSTTYLYKVYLKNLGHTAFVDPSKFDVFLGNQSQSLDYIPYEKNKNGKTFWNYTIIGGSSFTPQSTLVINTYTQNYYGPTIEAKIVLSNGRTVSGETTIG